MRGRARFNNKCVFQADSIVELARVGQTEKIIKTTILYICESNTHTCTTYIHIYVYVLHARVRENNSRLLSSSGRSVSFSGSGDGAF